MIVVWLDLSVSNHRHRHHHHHHHYQGGWTIIVILLHHDQHHHLHHHVPHHEHHPQGGREGGWEVWETDRGAWIQPPAAPGIHPHDTQVCPALIKSGLLRRKGSEAARTCSSRSCSSPRPAAAPLPSDRSLSERSTMLKKTILVDIYNLAEPDCCWIDFGQLSETTTHCIVVQVSLAARYMKSYPAFCHRCYLAEINQCVVPAISQ